MLAIANKESPVAPIVSCCHAVSPVSVFNFPAYRLGIINELYAPPLAVAAILLIVACVKAALILP